MGGEQVTLLQPCIDPLPKIIGTEATVNKNLGNSQGQARHHKTTNNNP